MNHYRRLRLRIERDNARYSVVTSLLLAAAAIASALFFQGAELRLPTYIAWGLVLIFAARASYYAQVAERLHQELTSLNEE